MSMEKNSRNSLVRNLSLFDSLAIVLGIVIGSGVFYKPSVVFQDVGSPVLGILAWIVGGLIALASGLTIAEIASAIPRTGGMFIYLKELYGDKCAFLYGWVQIMIYIPGSIAAAAVIFMTQLTQFTPLTYFQQKLLAVILVILFTILNILSTKLSSKFQSLSTIAKLIPIIAIVSLGFIMGKNNPVGAGISTNQQVLTGFAAALLGTLWAYDGWIDVTNLAGEIKNPKRNLPLAIGGGLVAIILIYVLFNVAILKALPFKTAMLSDKVASDALSALLGGEASKFIAIGIMISIVGTLNGYVMTGVRIPFAMAEEKLIPFEKFFGKIDKKYDTPLNAFIVQTVISVILVIVGSFNLLTDLIMFVMWIFFTMGTFGVFILRKKRTDIKRAYQVPLYPITPIIGIIGGLYIVVSTLISNFSFAFIGVLITLIGLPIYYLTIGKRRNQKN